jgi:hypothetical protein
MSAFLELSERSRSMPATNIEQLGQHEASLKKKIAEGGSLEAAQKRELGKQIRRAQRNAAARNAAKPAPAAEGAAEAKPAAAEESKEE